MILDRAPVGELGRAQGTGGRAPGRQAGMALVATILVLTLAGLLAAVAISGAVTGLRTATADAQDARAFYAAEAAGEAALAALDLAIQDGVITDAELAAITPPSLPGYDFTGFGTSRVGSVVVETITDGSFAGLKALTQDFDIYAPATDRADNHSAVMLTVKAQAIPIFQFGVFYEGDLEIHPGPPMDFLGRVHTNARLYLNANEARFHELLTTPLDVIANYKHKVVNRDGVWIKDDDGNFNLLLFDSRTIPDPEAFKARSDADFDNRLQSGAYGVETLKLPMPVGIPPREIVRPKEASDSPLEKETKLAWLADTYVTIDLDDIQDKSSVCGFGGTDMFPQIIIERPFGGAVPDAATKCNIYQWSWETFVDSREKKPVDALDINISQLRTWVNADPANNATELVYVEIIVADPLVSKALDIDPSADGHYPVVRAKNGQQLPGPLTLATERPLYIWGDFNTVNKQPSAVGGDAYHVLSNAWIDATHQIIREANGAGLTFATPTTINTAILAGHSATTCDINVDPGCSSPEYGGGFENYPRFLEHWSGVEYRFRGSIVSLWTAELALGKWYRSSADYYKPPVRNWGFDLDLLDPSKMPPGTPVVGSVIRTAFRDVY